MEWVKIGTLLEKSVISTVTPTFKLQNSDIADSGDVPVISQEKDFINGYTNNEDVRLKNGPFIVFGDHTECLKFVNFPFAQGADGIKIFKTDPLKMNSRYLYYALCGCYNKTGFYERHFKLLKKTCIPDYALDYQQNIVSVLSVYDDLIENNNKCIRILEQMAQELYKECFVRLRFPRYNDIKIKDGLPAGWEIKKLSDFGISLDTGKRPTGGIDNSLTDGVPSLGAEAINALAEFDYSSVKLVPIDFYNSMKRGRNTGNDILIYKDGAYIGKVTLFRNDFPYKNYVVNEHVFLLKPTDELYLNYLYFTLHQDAYFYLMQNLNRNAAQPGLSREDIKQIKITVPSETIIKSFNDIVEPILNKIFVLAKQNANLAKQRDLLLPRLMSSKLEIKGTDDA